MPIQTMHSQRHASTNDDLFVNIIILNLSVVPGIETIYTYSQHIHFKKMLNTQLACVLDQGNKTPNNLLEEMQQWQGK